MYFYTSLGLIMKAQDLDILRWLNIMKKSSGTKELLTLSLIRWFKKKKEEVKKLN